MSDVLSNDQVEALIEAARHGQAPSSAAVVPLRRRARRVREVDFSRPSKFAPDQQRRIERAHEGFCRHASTHLTTELLTPFDLEVLGVDQLTWATATAQLPQPSVSAVVGIDPLDTRMLLSVELPLLLRLIDRLMGGTGAGMVRPRDLTDIERALVRRLLETMLAQLTVTWDEMVGASLRVLDMQTVLANVNIVPPSEPSLVLTIEAKVAGSSSTISLILPHRSIEPAIDRLSGNQYGEAAVDPVAAGAVRAGVSQVEVVLRAEVCARHLPVSEVLALRPGDVLRFPGARAGSVRLCAGAVPAHTARPGRSGNLRAVQVTAALGGAA